MKMQDEHLRQIKETGWRRPLTPEEQAALQGFLQAHPEAQEGWREEAGLNRLLQRLPAPVVSSNFTARLLQAVQKAPARRTWRQWLVISTWLPEGQMARFAMGCTVVCLGLLSFRETQLVHRAHVARELAGVSRVAALPSMEWLKNFDTINRISQVKVADDELLAALE